MKYLITQEQWNFLNRNAMAVGAKPIEPLSDNDIMQMWQDAWDSTEKGWIFPIYARAVEEHILGEKHDS